MRHASSARWRRCASSAAHRHGHPSAHRSRCRRVRRSCSPQLSARLLAERGAGDQARPGNRFLATATSVQMFAAGRHPIYSALVRSFLTPPDAPSATRPAHTEARSPPALPGGHRLRTSIEELSCASLSLLPDSALCTYLVAVAPAPPQRRTPRPLLRQVARQRWCVTPCRTLPRPVASEQTDDKGVAPLPDVPASPLHHHQRRRGGDQAVGRCVSAAADFIGHCRSAATRERPSLRRTAQDARYALPAKSRTTATSTTRRSTSSRGANHVDKHEVLLT